MIESNQKLADKTIVLKYGGHAMDSPELRESFFDDLKQLIHDGFKFVIVHGGGPQINNLLQRLEIKSNFVNGLRITDNATLEVVEMALCGKVNKMVVRMIMKSGLNAAGISGEDGKLLLARQKNIDLGLVGEICEVNPEILQILLAGDFVPVVAPLALDDEGNVLNVNADTAAGAIAGALGAKYFILISDVPGVLDENGNLYSHLSSANIEELCKKNIINGGMIPKVEACLEAIRKGTNKAMILDGRMANSLRNFLLKKSMPGTEINL